MGMDKKFCFGCYFHEYRCTQCNGVDECDCPAPQIDKCKDCGKMIPHKDTMDPDICLRLIYEALKLNKLETAAKHMYNLAIWVKDGGFNPGDDDSLAKELGIPYGYSPEMCYVADGWMVIHRIQQGK